MQIVEDPIKLYNKKKLKLLKVAIITAITSAILAFVPGMFFVFNLLPKYAYLVFATIGFAALSFSLGLNYAIEKLSPYDVSKEGK